MLHEAGHGDVLQLEYAGGVEVRLDYAWNQPSPTKGLLQHSRILGSEGTIGFESNGLYLWTAGKGVPSLRLPGFADLMGYGAMTADFLQCLQQRGKEPYSNFERARRDMHIVFAAYQQL